MTIYNSYNLRVLTYFLILTSVNMYGQTDTIFTSNGDLLLVDVTEINHNTIKYSYPNENFSNSISKNIVNKINYKSGRKQIFTSNVNLLTVKYCLDWDNVQISNIESEILGLYKIDYVGTKAKGKSVMASRGKLQNKVYKTLKMKTAMLGGNIVYILNQDSEGAKYTWFGSSLPTNVLAGIVYSSKKVSWGDISNGEYNISYSYILYPNQDKIVKKSIKPKIISINKEDLTNENNFYKLNLSIKPLFSNIECTVIYANISEIVLSCVDGSRNDKNVYYNLILTKI